MVRCTDVEHSHQRVYTRRRRAETTLVLKDTRTTVWDGRERDRTTGRWGTRSSAAEGVAGSLWSTGWSLRSAAIYCEPLCHQPIGTTTPKPTIGFDIGVLSISIAPRRRRHICAGSCSNNTLIWCLNISSQVYFTCTDQDATAGSFIKQRMNHFVVNSWTRWLWVSSQYQKYYLFKQPRMNFLRMHVQNRQNFLLPKFHLFVVNLSSIRLWFSIILKLLSFEELLESIKRCLIKNLYFRYFTFSLRSLYLIRNTLFIKLRYM